MTTMDKLSELLARCKCGVYVQINVHRDVYDTASQWWEQQDCISGDSLRDTTASVRAEMMRLDTVVDVQFYPDTPTGFFRIAHFDLEAALTEALGCLDT